MSLGLGVKGLGTQTPTDNQVEMTWNLRSHGAIHRHYNVRGLLAEKWPLAHSISSLYKEYVRFVLSPNNESPQAPQ